MSCHMIMSCHDVLLLMLINKDSIHIIKEYVEGYDTKLDEYPKDNREMHFVCNEWHFSQECKVYTHKGYIYIKDAHHMECDKSVVIWYKSKKNIYTCHNIKNKIREIYG